MDEKRFQVTNVEFDADLAEDWLEIESVLQEYAVRLHTDIFVRYTGGYAQSPIPAVVGQLNLWFYARPADREYVSGQWVETEWYSMAYGIDLRGGSQGDVLAPASGVVDIRETEGSIVAQVVDNNLYILLDLPCGPVNNLTVVLRRIMEDYVFLERSSAEEKTVRTQSINETSRDELVKMMLASREIDKRDVEKELRRLDRLMRDQQRRLLASAAKYEETLQRKCELEGAATLTTADVEELYQELVSLSPSGEVLITDHFIRVDVGQIDIEYLDTTYDVGEFWIFIYPKGDRSGVRCVNRTRLIGGFYHHPHVGSDGHCCLGSISTLVVKLIAHRQYTDAVRLMTQFLLTFTGRGYYVPIEDWPEKE